MKTKVVSLAGSVLAVSLLLLASCGGGSDDPVVDGAISDGQVAIDVHVVDARTIDAGPAGTCVATTCQNNGSDSRCDDLDMCTPICGGAGGSRCALGFQCQTNRCTCDVLSCGGLGMGRRCVANNTGGVNVPGGSVTLCTKECGVGWPPCSSGYECQGSSCERQIMP
jgi:hypothetical protein